VSNHVLHDFAKADRDWLEPAIDAISTALPVLIERDCTAFLAEINRLRPSRTKPPPPAREPPESTSE